jgi:hypothetical protein
MNARPGRILVLAAALCLVLSGCSGTKRALGFSRTAPDEFAVVQQAPLSMPPDYHMRPPRPGAARPQVGTTRQQAKDVLLGLMHPSGTESGPGLDTADIDLLKRCGAEQIQPGIRQLVDKETEALADANKSFTDALIFWRKAAQPGDGEVLNAAEEAKRLHEDEALGRAVTAGETPRIERVQKGFLEGLF